VDRVFKLVKRGGGEHRSIRLRGKETGLHNFPKESRQGEMTPNFFYVPGTSRLSLQGGLGTGNVFSLRRLWRRMSGDKLTCFLGTPGNKGGCARGPSTRVEGTEDAGRYPSGRNLVEVLFPQRNWKDLFLNLKTNTVQTFWRRFNRWI